MFSSELFEKIIQAWEADQNRRLSGGIQKPLPNTKDVRAIIEAAFWSSLKQEEGRPINFALALLSKSILVEQEEVARNQILRFDQSLPLTVESITKLASAFDPKTSALIAAPINDQRNEYELWGAIIYVPQRHEFIQSTVSMVGLTNLSRPDALLVSAVASGSLLISRGEVQIGRFVSGEFIRAVPTPFNYLAMGDYIVSLIKEDEGYKDNLNYRNKYENALEYLLAEASARGHGGIIIVVPEKEVEGCKQQFTPNYTFCGDLRLDYLIRKIAQPDLSLSEYQMYKNCCAERLDLLAQFSCIDGALVLSSRLEVISFGAKLDAPDWVGNVIVGPDGFGGRGEIFDFSRLGTRHASSIKFIGACPGALGFVLSEDGPIRGLTRRDDRTILCWPDCRLSLFL